MIQSSNLTFIKFELGDLGIPVASSQGVSSSNNFHVLHIRARVFMNSSGPLFSPCIATITSLFTNLEPGWCPVLDSAKSV